MKILMCTQEYYPKGSGIANSVYYQVEELKKRGHQVIVMSPYGPDIKLGCEKEIEKYGGMALLFFWNKISRYINKKHKRFDHIIVNNPLFLRKIKCPKKVYAIYHSTYLGYHRDFKNLSLSIKDKIYYRIMKKIERLTFKINQFKYSGVGPEIIDEIIQQGIKRSKVRYIPNGVDINFFKPINLNNKEIKLYNVHTKSFKIIPQDHKILLSVGRIEHQKQPQKLITMFEYLEKSNLKYFLIFAGDGTLRHYCQKMVNRKGLRKVIFLGKVEHKKLPKLYNQSEAYIMSSCNEPQGITLAEAMSCGLPFIVSDIPNLTHFVNDCNTGLAVNFNKPKEASEKVIEYLKIAKKESKNIRTYAINTFQWKDICEKHFKLMGLE